MAKGLKVMTLQEVADKLKISKRTAWRYYKDGDLKGIKLNGGIRIPEEEFNKFVRERTN